MVQRLDGGTLETLHAIFRHMVKDPNEAILSGVIDGCANVLNAMCA